MDIFRAASAATQFIATLFAIALVSISLQAVAADAPLTLPEAQRRAVDRSRQLVAQDSAIAASPGDLDLYKARLSKDALC